jgi:hypothetical protein
MDLLPVGKQEYNSYGVGRSPKGSTAMGCLHGWVLSLLLWSLIMGKLICELNGDYYMTGYENDIAILIIVKFPQTMSESSYN